MEGAGGKYVFLCFGTLYVVSHDVLDESRVHFFKMAASRGTDHMYFAPGFFVGLGWFFCILLIYVGLFYSGRTSEGRAVSVEVGICAV